MWPDVDVPRQVTASTWWHCNFWLLQCVAAVTCGFPLDFLVYFGLKVVLANLRLCLGSLSCSSMNSSPQRFKPEGGACLWRVEWCFYLVSLDLKHCGIILSPVYLPIHTLMLLVQISNLDSLANTMFSQSLVCLITPLVFSPLSPTETWFTNCCLSSETTTRQPSFDRTLCWLESCIDTFTNPVSMMNMPSYLSGD